jgi:hypothetical protein
MKAASAALTWVRYSFDSGRSFGRGVPIASSPMRLSLFSGRGGSKLDDWRTVSRNGAPLVCPSLLTWIESGGPFNATELLMSLIGHEGAAPAGRREVCLLR